MRKYVAKRLAMAVPVLLGVSVLLYLFISLTPGDPVSMMTSPDQRHMASPEWVEAQRERLGLNAPLPIRYARWLQETLTGNLGFSIRANRPVTDMILHRLPATLELAGAGLAISLLIGVPSGIIAAVKQGSVIDKSTTVLVFTFLSVPSFVVGLIAISLFALKLNWLPTSGRVSLGLAYSLTDHFRHLILPALVIGLEGAASLMRFTRTAMVEALEKNFIVTARAWGLHPATVYFGFAFRSALLPILTLIGLRVPILISGTVIIEKVFNWPGLGTLLVDGVTGSDYPLVMGIGMFTAFIVLFSALATDISYAYADPRIRYDRS